MPNMIGSSKAGQPRLVLASRSPRRMELLQLLAPAHRIDVVPPRDSSEAGFEGLGTLPAIERRIAEIARAKALDVAAQFDVNSGSSAAAERSIVIAADTAIVAYDRAGGTHVLGKPPEDDIWENTVRGWFREFYAGRTHLAVTGLCVQEGSRTIERIVRTEVTFTSTVERNLEWYLSTSEPRGKAGGYAIQGAGSIFVTNISGSLSNVIGLPLEALCEIFATLNIELARS